jgi:hypothetical protein
MDNAWGIPGYVSDAQPMFLDSPLLTPTEIETPEQYGVAAIPTVEARGSSMDRV